jgi:hypothetical protein
MVARKSKLCKRETIKWLANAPILAFPDFDKPFIIQGDVSAKALGGACLQGNSTNFDNANYFNPCNFSSVESSERSGEEMANHGPRIVITSLWLQTKQAFLLGSTCGIWTLNNFKKT